MADFPERLLALEPFWGSWKLDAPIGEGSYGKVYRIRREEFGNVYTSALKWIALPQNQNDLRTLFKEGMTEDSVRTYYYDLVRNLQTEITLMNRLRGTSHVVSFEDHAFIERTDEIGWDVLIRMELLTPLPDHVWKGMTVRDVIRMGLDMCDALTLCGKNNIVHRDIKPDNIFYSENGDYKLGDFGVARQMERTMTNMSVKGTPFYMAPEVYGGKPSDASVDQYSLGLVMHRLLNAQKVPFSPMTDRILTGSEREEAFLTRMRGVPIPPPLQGGVILKQAICRACNPNLKKRFSGPEAMRAELENALREKECGDPLILSTVSPLRSGRSDVGALNAGAEGARHRRRAFRWGIAATVLFLVALIGAGVWLYTENNQNGLHAQGAVEMSNKTEKSTEKARSGGTVPLDTDTLPPPSSPPSTMSQAVPLEKDAAEAVTGALTEIPDTTYTVSIQWDDQSDLEGLRPEKITVQLTLDGKQVASGIQSLNKENQWRYQWTNLTGGACALQVDDVPAYQATMRTENNQTVIRLSHEAVLTAYTVNLQWEDRENPDGTRPENVYITLFCNDEQASVKKSIPSGQERYTWENLPQHIRGRKAVYSVAVDQPDGYRITLTQQTDTGVTAVFQGTVSSTPTAMPAVSPAPKEQNDDVIAALDAMPETELTPASIIASDTRGVGSDGVTTYDTAYLLDNDDNTSWQVTDGVGATLTIALNEPSYVTQLRVKNGYWKSDSRYYRNYRAQGIEVSYQYSDAVDFVDAESFVLSDTGIDGVWQAIRLTPHANTRALRITLTSSYPSQTYQGSEPYQTHDIAINELRVDGKQMPEAANPVFISSASHRLASGTKHTLAILADGTFSTFGSNEQGQLNIDARSQTGVVAVAAGEAHSLALHADGTVTAAGADERRCVSDVAAWSGIVDIAAGFKISVGLQSDGRVVCSQANLNTSDWTDIVQIACGEDYVLGLRSDGTMCSAYDPEGFSSKKMDRVLDWKNIVFISGGRYHCLGVDAEGNVYSVGSNPGELDSDCLTLNAWSGQNVVAVGAGYGFSIGLKSDGTLLATGYNASGQCNVQDWTGVCQIVVGGYQTFGIRADGTVLCCGSDDNQQTALLSGLTLHVP